MENVTQVNIDNLTPIKNLNRNRSDLTAYKNKYESTKMHVEGFDKMTPNLNIGETITDYNTMPIVFRADSECFFDKMASHGQKRKNVIHDEAISTKKCSLITSEDKKNIHLRKNIRDVMNENNLDTTTIVAQREESERLARVAGQQKTMREVRKHEHKSLYRIFNLEPSEGNLVSQSTSIVLPDEKLKSATCVDTNSSSNSDSIDNILDKVNYTDHSNDIVTIDDSSDDDCILLSEDEGDYNESDDGRNSGMHVKDIYNNHDEHGRVVVNIAHPEGEETLYLAPQIAKIIKPHQIGGVRFLYDNIIESTRRFKKSSGFGCILAHSMGLGKTLQVVSFCDIFLRHTPARTVLCVMPINTLQNWLSEFNMWLPRESADISIRPRNFEIFVLNDQHKNLTSRAKVILNWVHKGGVLLIGYELFRLLSLKLVNTRKKSTNKHSLINDPIDTSKDLKNMIFEALVKPGPDLVICDEGHRIKNSHAGISLALKQIRTRRRIVLTGYPLQNNLLEYWCMVDFVRPNYLGTRTEFCNMFERPIQNGQCVDSTPDDIKLMRYRAHVLHSLLLGFVQRRSHSVLQCTLPQKLEYVILVRMTTFQRKLYDTFMSDVVRKKTFPNPLKAFAVCCKIWNHPDVLYTYLKKCETDLDLEIDEESLKNNTSSTIDSNLSIAHKVNPITTQHISGGQLDTSTDVKNYAEKSCEQFRASKEDLIVSDFNQEGKGNYWLDASIPTRPRCIEVIKQFDSNIVNEFETITGSSEIVDLDTNEIKTVKRNTESTINNQEKSSDGVSINSIPLKIPFQSSLTTIVSDTNKKGIKQKKTDDFTCSWAVDIMKNYVSGQITNSPKMEIFFCIMKESISMGDRILLFSQSLLTLNLIEGFLKSNFIPCTTKFWVRNDSYFRLDGSTSSQERERLVNDFNANRNIKLFLISTRAGSLGINLTGANRVIIFDASWNPCHDTQAVYRIYRYGQTKPCYVYRLVMDKCLEKKIYDRQIKKQGMSDRIVDECNPEAHLSMKDITNLCHDYDSDDDPAGNKDINCSKSIQRDELEIQSSILDKLNDTFSTTYSDSIINTIIKIHAKNITKDPFLHESLLIDQKDRKLSQAEKRQAHKSYELEKKASINQKYAYSPGKMHILNSNGSVITRPVASVRPLQTKKNNYAVGGRSTRWIPAEVWQRQGMTAQEMTLPLDVVIPTNSSDRSNIVLNAGQRVMVLKSPKGIYMQLDSGKIIAIRTTSKTHQLEKSTEDVIDITSDCDGDNSNPQSPERVIMDNVSHSNKTGTSCESQIPVSDTVGDLISETKPQISCSRNENVTNSIEELERTTVNCEYRKQQVYNNELQFPTAVPCSLNSHLSSSYQQFVSNNNGLLDNSYGSSKNIQQHFPAQYYNCYENKNSTSVNSYNINNYASYRPYNFTSHHSNYQISGGYNESSTPIINTNSLPRQPRNSVVNHQTNNESICHPQYKGNSYSINEWFAP